MIRYKLEILLKMVPLSLTNLQGLHKVDSQQTDYTVQPSKKKAAPKWDGLFSIAVLSHVKIYAGETYFFNTLPSKALLNTV